MNKQKFIELLRTPEKMSGKDLSELHKLVHDNPYFQSGYTVLAKGSRLLKLKNSSQLVNRAALYATNRNVFKNYLLSQLSPAVKTKPKKSSVQKTQVASSKTSKPRNAPQLLSKTEHDKVIEEIYENLEKWKINRDHYLEFEKAHPEDIIIKSLEAEPELLPDSESIDLQDDAMEKLKSQVAEEVKAEETKSSIEEESVEEEITDPVEEKDEIKPEEIVEEPAAPTSEETSVPDVESIEDIEVSSIYSFGSKKSGEEEIPKPEEKEASQISSEELSAIVDEAASAMEKEETTEEPSPEPIVDENQDIGGAKGLPTITDVHKMSQIDNEGEELENAPDVDHSESKEIAHEVGEISEPEEEIVEEEKVIETTDETDTPELSSEPEEIIEETPASEEAVEPETKEDIVLDLDIDSEKSTVESEEELNQLDLEKEELKLQPSQTSKEKKFRLSILKKPIKFIKSNRDKKLKKEATTPVPAESKKQTTSTTKKSADTTKKTAAKKDTTTKKKSTAKKTKATTKPKSTTVKKAEKKSKKISKDETDDSDGASKISGEDYIKTVKDSKKKSKSKVAPPKKESEQIALINKFLEENPSIKVKHGKSENIEDLSKANENFPSNLISENLANILETQGKNKLAISVLEKLKEKYPQNKSLYQSKIKSIDSKKSSSKKKGVDFLLNEFMESHSTVIVNNYTEVEEIISDATSDMESISEPFIVENTANILLQMNESKKALSIYEKLILKFPQKKSYFASQIENIKKK